MSLSGLFNIMSCYDDRLAMLVTQANQVVPNAVMVTEERWDEISQVNKWARGGGDIELLNGDQDEWYLVLLGKGVGGGEAS